MMITTIIIEEVAQDIMVVKILTPVVIEETHIMFVEIVIGITSKRDMEMNAIHMRRRGMLLIFYGLSLNEILINLNYFVYRGSNYYSGNNNNQQYDERYYGRSNPYETNPSYPNNYNSYRGNGNVFKFKLFFSLASLANCSNLHFSAMLC